MTPPLVVRFVIAIAELYMGTGILYSSSKKQACFYACFTRMMEKRGKWR